MNFVKNYNLRSYILKIALFATGLSGIVAEYILSTLATHFLGDSVFQWTMIVSIMMFSMGLGSRLSKLLKKNLIESFIIIEFSLSILVSFSSLLAYSAAAYTVYAGLIIYLLSIIIGILIGLEIPLVVRLNESFEELRINVASVIEMDYYGCLAGGLFYAFVGLPIIGLTLTPFILGGINFIVAFSLFLMLRKNLYRPKKQLITAMSVVVIIFLHIGILYAKPIIQYGEQKKYKDLVIFSEQSRYQKIVITQWREHYWLYINGNQQLSTLDEILYHEPLVHPAAKLVDELQYVLIMGGGDGCAARELLKYHDIKQITLVDIDPKMTELGQTNPILVELNKNAMNNEKVKIINTDGYTYMAECEDFFDLIVIDLPDPKTVELGRLYSYEFYSMCYKHLHNNGVLVTQAGSPYYATRAFLCIDKTLQEAGFSTLPIHNQVITLGEWAWVIGTKNQMPKNSIKTKLRNANYSDIYTEWLNNEAIDHIVSFGKIIYPAVYEQDTIEVNTLHNPVLYKYYLKGNWDLY